MTKTIKKLISVFGILLFINGSITSAFSNFNIGNLLCILVGFFIFFFAYGDRAVSDSVKSTGIYKAFKTSICILCAASIGVTAVLNIYGSFDTCNYTEDAIIVPGAAVKGTKVSAPLAYRLDSAYDYLLKNPSAIVVVSGGQGYQEDISEAEAMKNYLLEKGIDYERIVCEDKSTSTHENFKFSKKILDDMLPKGYTTVYTTNNFHVYRAGRIAESVGLQSTHKGAKLQWYNLAPNGFRECLAVAKNIVFGG